MLGDSRPAQIFCGCRAARAYMKSTDLSHIDTTDRSL